MVNWENLRNLHVVAKISEILNRWYGVEVIFADSLGKIRSNQLEKTYRPKGHFFKVQMSLSLGHQYISQDIDDATAELKKGAHGTGIIHQSLFKHLKMAASSMVIDGEYAGAILVYPFITEDTTAQERQEIARQLNQAGMGLEDAERAVASLKALNADNEKYLQELVALMAAEVVGYHQEIGEREKRIQELNSELGNKYRYHNMIGKSKSMQAIYRLLDKAASSEASVLIQGENGTGKELVAKAIHYYSLRKDNVFMALHCSALNDNLLDSELFGHVKGAFTSASKDKKGLLEMANGGTLFLDEIGDISLPMQVKLLRVLQEGTFLPVGATSPRHTDVRMIAATNKNVKDMIERGQFREDLYCRLGIVNVHLPPLKERAEDIPLLMEHFLKKSCDEKGLAMKSFARSCMEKMLDYHWPGNIRELESEIERLVVLAREDKAINPELLSPHIVDALKRPEDGLQGIRGIKAGGKLKEALERLERLMIAEGLDRCNFNKSKLSKELGISRASLIMKVEKYALDKRKRAVGE